MKKYLVYIICFFSIVGKSFSQSDCSQSLKKAQKFYDNGELHMVVKQITPCLEEGYTDLEKEQAFELLILTSLFDDNIIEAEKNMINLLKLNPDFSPDSNDHTELKKLYSKFRTEPLITIELMGGVNYTYAKSTTYYSFDNAQLNEATDFDPDYAGITFGLNGNYLLKKKLRASLGFLYSTRKYQITDQYKGFNFDGIVLNDISATHTITSLELPIGLYYELGNSKLRPFIRLGGSAILNIASEHNLQRSFNDGINNNITGTPVDTKDQMSSFDFTVFGGVGLKFKISATGNLIFDGRYSMGFLNQTKADNRYLNSELVYKYFYVPDDYSISNMTLMIGYSHSIFKPKKLKEFRD